MSGSARSIAVFGGYLLGLGAILLIAPNVLLKLFLMPETAEVWIRVVGMLAGFLGVYYFQAARRNLVDFFRWTVPVRASVPLFFGAFVVTGLAGPMLIAFGIIDLAGAIWTAVELRRDSRRSA